MLLLALCCLLTGHVSAATGTPVSNAHITIEGPARIQTSSNAAGVFTARVDPGDYRLTAAAAGFVQTTAGPFDVIRDENVDVVLQPVNAPQLRVIGSVTVNGILALQRNVVPSVDISRQDLDALGSARIIQGLQEIPSVTFARPDGGAETAPSLVALRGPDPSETLVALDGQILNDANTGDLDLSRFPVAAFASVDVTEGLGPSDSEGSNTIGGAVNLISLRPTQKPHSALSLSTRSFGTNEAWYNASGSHGRFGYALALDDLQEQGFVNQNVIITTPVHLGSAIASRTALANGTWSFSQQADLSFRIFTMGNTRDESSALNAPVDSNAQGAGAKFTGPGAAQVAQSVRAYQLQGRAPLGAGALAYAFSASNNSVNFIDSSAGPTPYDLTHQDKRATVSLAWLRETESSEFALGGYVRGESFTADGVNGALTQRISSYFARGATQLTKRLHASAGVFVSHYTTFGTNLDGRIGAEYDLGGDSLLHASAGTGFRAPLLIERYVFPLDDLPPPDENCVITGQGNPGEKPEHATEYELGYAKRFAERANLDVSLYRTNLRDPIEVFYPLGACASPNAPLQSYPINVGNAVYQGGEVRYTLRMNPHLVAIASYGLNIAYPLNMPPAVSNPTSGADLVAGQQFANIPQQQGSLRLNWSNGRWHAATGLAIRGKNNELNQGPFALLDAAVGYDAGNAAITLADTNLTSAVAGKFTLLGMGAPYNGVAGPLPTDLFFLEPAAVRLDVTLKI